MSKFNPTFNAPARLFDLLSGVWFIKPIGTVTCKLLFF